MERLVSLYNTVFRHEPASVKALAGAGSNRKYFRLADADGHTVVGVIGTSEEENRAFCRMTEAFTQRGLNVPKLIARSDDHMVYLVEDLGDISLFDCIRNGREAGGAYSEHEQRLIAQAIAMLPRFQFEAAGDDVFANSYPQSEMDRMSVMFDLNYFKYNFLKLSGVEFNEVKLQADFESFADDLLKENTNTFLYRDFQARNVMVRASHDSASVDDGGNDGDNVGTDNVGTDNVGTDNVYFIDYQGGRRGPVYYDVASFLWQASSLFTDELRERMIDVYLAALHPYLPMERDEFMPKLRLFVLFRLLQVLGAYGFRGLWEKKKHFIDSIPPALENVDKELAHGTCDKYPYLKEVCLELIGWQRNRPKAKGGIRVYSFSYKKGIPDDCSGNGGGYVFDCRGSNNPGRYDEYKPLTGLDQPVIDFLEKDGEIVDFLNKIYPIADFHVQRWLDRGFSDLMFCFGCTGGRHRSVYSAQHLAEHIHKKFGVDVYLCHRERGIEQTLTKHETR